MIDSKKHWFECKSCTHRLAVDLCEGQKLENTKCPLCEEGEIEDTQELVKSTVWKH